LQIRGFSFIFHSMNKKLYLSKRPGALGALMDLYEQEAELLFETINKQVKDEDWSVIKDAATKDEDCRSIQTICQHIVGAAEYYIELLKKGENEDYEMIRNSVILPEKKDFEPRLKEVLAKQSACHEQRWDMSYENVSAIKIKTGWGAVLDPDGLMEHAVLHIMRHQRQVLNWVR